MRIIKIFIILIIFWINIFASDEIDLSEIFIEEVINVPKTIGIDVKADYLAWSPDDKFIFFHDNKDRENYLLDVEKMIWIPLKFQKPHWLGDEKERIEWTKKEISYSPDGLLGIRFRKPDKEIEIFKKTSPFLEFVVPIILSNKKTFTKTFYIRRECPLFPAWSHNGKYIAIYSKQTYIDSYYGTKILKIGGYEPQIKKEEPKKITKTLPLTTKPKLTFNYSLLDENQNKILDGGERIILKVVVKNEGEGEAEGVKVVLSGGSKLLNYLDKEKYIGNISANSEKEAIFETVLPYKIEADDANLIIKVTEERGFDALKEAELLIAMEPAKVKREKEIISVIVDVDKPLAPTNFRRENGYAVIIGISDYRSTKIPKIKYAKRDAEVMKDYLIKVCGIPEENIIMLTDEKATKSDIEAYLEEWLQRNVNKNSFVFVYFAGHGTPNPEKGDAYLVPYDGEPGFISKLYPLSKVYNSLENLPTENIVVALDACFSGAGGRSVIEEGKRPLVNVKIEKSGQKIAVLTASAADEISQDLDNKQHGLFTYYFLKGLRGEADANKDNWITLEELYNYCYQKVKEESRKLGYTQTPKIFPYPLDKKANLKIGKIR